MSPSSQETFPHHSLQRVFQWLPETGRGVLCPVISGFLVGTRGNFFWSIWLFLDTSVEYLDYCFSPFRLWSSWNCERHNGFVSWLELCLCIWLAWFGSRYCTIKRTASNVTIPYISSYLHLSLTSINKQAVSPSKAQNVRISFLSRMAPPVLGKL